MCRYMYVGVCGCNEINYSMQFLSHKISFSIARWLPHGFFRIQIHNELFIEILAQPFGTNSLQCRQEGFAQLPLVDNEYKSKLMRNNTKNKVK